MASVIAFHEVDNVEHWLSSPKREELFGEVGITVRTFVDPEGSNRTGVMLEVPDLETLQQVMGSDAAAAAMEFDGVRADTLVMLVEG